MLVLRRACRSRRRAVVGPVGEVRLGEVEAIHGGEPVRVEVVEVVEVPTASGEPRAIGYVEPAPTGLVLRRSRRGRWAVHGPSTEVQLGPVEARMPRSDEPVRVEVVEVVREADRHAFGIVADFPPTPRQLRTIDRRLGRLTERRAGDPATAAMAAQVRARLPELTADQASRLLHALDSALAKTPSRRAKAKV